ncbi:uncharacterized protein BJ171DRAFT_484921 [Polychytrium aggregatum]|uniref:uncharacterized protein n=1 Tax=Polychytrium aggregatum TaxID=110093 RepID=UPI0022FF433F|nr:uncharacterized protein BJ171DRAFT_484921 [Polychytrium aggregatum]KAI9209757.1 hypothetical protein BJ171DRAFT_484921 [Polychytrium aggregatum]
MWSSFRYSSAKVFFLKEGTNFQYSRQAISSPCLLGSSYLPVGSNRQFASNLSTSSQQIQSKKTKKYRNPPSDTAVINRTTDVPDDILRTIGILRTAIRVGDSKVALNHCIPSHYPYLSTQDLFRLIKILSIAANESNHRNANMTFLPKIQEVWEFTAQHLRTSGATELIPLGSYGPFFKFLGDQGNISMLEQYWAQIGELCAKPDIYVFNRRLEALRVSNAYTQVVHEFEKMESVYSLTPDRVSYRVLLQALGKLKKSNQAQEFLSSVEIENMSPVRKYHFYVALCRAFCTEDNLERARSCLDSLRDNNLLLDHQIYDVMMAAYSKADRMDDALQVFSLMKEDALRFPTVKPTTETYNILLQVFVRSKNIEAAERIFATLCEKFEPNAITYSTMMTAYRVVGNYDAVRKTFGEMVKRGVELQMNVFNCLLLIARNPGEVARILALAGEHDLAPTGNTINALVVNLCKHNAIQSLSSHIVAIQGQNVSPTHDDFKKIIMTCRTVGAPDEIIRQLLDYAQLCHGASVNMCNFVLARSNPGTPLTPRALQECFTNFFDPYDVQPNGHTIQLVINRLNDRSQSDLVSRMTPDQQAEWSCDAVALVNALFNQITRGGSEPHRITPSVHKTINSFKSKLRASGMH